MAGTGQGWASDSGSGGWNNHPFIANEDRPEIHAVIGDKNGVKAEFREDGLVQISDPETFGVLNRILKELRVMNIQLTIMTDNEIGKWEVD